MKTIFFSIPSGSHKRAYFQPLLLFLKNNLNLQVICISPLAKYPKWIQQREVRLPKAKENGIFWGVWDKKLFDQYQPSLVTASTCGLDDKDILILAEAKKRRIKTLVYVESWDNVWKMERHKESMIKADHILVWNKMMQEHLMRALDYQKEEIGIVGSPRLDNLIKAEDLSSKAELFQFMNNLLPGEYKKIDLDPNKPLIHIATVELYDNSYMVKIVCEAREKARKINKESQLAKAQIYCSVHPGGNMGRHLQYAKKYGVDMLKFSFGRNESAPIKEFRYNPSIQDMKMLYGLFLHSDLLVNFSSTAALESCIADTPVINVKFGKPFDFWRWHESPVFKDFQEHYKDITDQGGTFIARNKKELIKAIESYLRNPKLDQKKRCATAKKLITFLDGRCSERVYQEIIKII